LPVFTGFFPLSWQKYFLLWQKYFLPWQKPNPANHNRPS